MQTHDSRLLMIVTLKRCVFVPFHWSHALAMNLRPFDRAHFDTIPDYRERLLAITQAGLSKTAVVDGDMVCSFGVVELWPGVAEAWMLTSYNVERFPISLTRGARRYFDHIYSDLKLHRLQIMVDCRNVIAIKWAKALKLTEEGTLRGYGPDGSDHLVFAKVE